MAIVLKSPIVLRDIEGIAGHIEQYRPFAATRFIGAVREAFAYLAEHPTAGDAMPVSLHPALRVMSVGGRFANYVICFEPIEGGIHVVRVLHGAQHLPQVLRDGDEE